MGMYSTKQILQYSQSYVKLLDGADVTKAVQLHAQMADINLKYIKLDGPDIWNVNRVFSAANAQGKFQNLLNQIVEDGISILGLPISEIVVQSPKIQNLKTIGYLPSNMVVDIPEIAILSGEIYNPREESIRAFIKTSINGVSDTVLVSLDVPHGILAIPRVRPPRFLPEEAKEIGTTIRSVPLTVELLLQGNVLVDSYQTDIWISQPDICLIASKDADELRDFSYLLSWWVNSGAEGISDFLVEHIPDDIRNNFGYGFGVPIDVQVEHIYNAFLRKPMNFMPTELIWIAEKSSIIQRIQRPEQILLSNIPKYNCLDGAILFASILEHIGVDPILVIVPSHAFVGWKKEPKQISNVREYLDFCNYLDFTAQAANLSFDVSVSSAQGQFTKYFDEFSREPKSINSFVKLIDVKKSRGFPLGLY